jgi:hypothetical protein
VQTSAGIGKAELQFVRENRQFVIRIQLFVTMVRVRKAGQMAQGMLVGRALRGQSGGI